MVHSAGYDSDNACGPPAPSKAWADPFENAAPAQARRVGGCGRRRLQGNQDLEGEGCEVILLEDLVAQVVQRPRANGDVADRRVAEVEPPEVARTAVLLGGAGQGLHQRVRVEGRFYAAVVQAKRHLSKGAWQRMDILIFAIVQFCLQAVARRLASCDSLQSCVLDSVLDSTCTSYNIIMQTFALFARSTWHSVAHDVQGTVDSSGVRVVLGLDGRTGNRPVNDVVGRGRFWLWGGAAEAPAFGGHCGPEQGCCSLAENLVVGWLQPACQKEASLPALESLSRMQRLRVASKQISGPVARRLSQLVESYPPPDPQAATA